MDQKLVFKNTLIIVVIGILLFCGIQNYTVIFKLLEFIIHLVFPFILGGAIAFILNVPMRAIERHLFPNQKKLDSFRRLFAYLLTLILVIGILGLALFVIIPQVSSTIKLIIIQIPIAFSSFQEWLYKITADLPNVQTYLDDLQLNWSSISSHAINLIKTAGSTVFSSSISIVSGIIGGVTTFFIAFVFSIYLIFQKEKLSSQIKQTLYAFLPEEKADRTVYIGRLSNRIFSSFLSGQCIEAVILGTMFFITLSIFRLPYALLIGVVIAITALIPIFGAFIGCAIGAFLIVMVNPIQALWFIVIFLVLQQIEGNLIYPHVVGGSIGLPSLWVLVAVTVGGSLMGIAGILLFIPLCSVCYALFRELVKKRLEKKKIASKKWLTPQPKGGSMTEDAPNEPIEPSENSDKTTKDSGQTASSPGSTNTSEKKPESGSDASNKKHK